MKKILFATTALLAAGAFSTSAQASDVDTTVDMVMNQDYFMGFKLGTSVAPEDGHDRSAIMGISGGVHLDLVGSDDKESRLMLEYVNLDSGSNSAFSSDVDEFLLTYQMDVSCVSYKGITPYVGMSVGYMSAEGSDFVSNESGLVYGAGFGINYELNEQWTWTTGYRYMRSEDVSTYNNDGLEQYDSNEITTGLRLSF